MKRNYTGVPKEMMTQWGRPLLSCRPCRQQKRRCDRQRPCSNCSQRNISCEYTENQHIEVQRGKADDGLRQTTTNLPPRTTDQVFHLAQSPEEAALLKPSRGPRRPQDEASHEPPLAFHLTPFSFHSRSTSPRGIPLDTGYLAGHLPPISEARELFTHFVATMQPTIGILHIPSTRHLMEQMYQGMLDGQAPDAATLLLFFGIFAGSALSTTPGLLQKLNSTQAQATAASKAYMCLSLSIIEDPQQLPASTLALAGMTVMAHLILNERGPLEAHLTRTRCHWMARSMQIHRLDAARSKEERNLKGYNEIDIEVQRRIWWSLVASDWLSGFCGGVQEGSYTFQPNHMCVDYPSNVDDEHITATEISNIQPISQHTSTISLIYRAKFATICREVIDAMPSMTLEAQEPDYNTILALDARFQSYLNDLPAFARLDTASLRQSESICAKRPYISWQRTTAHLSFHTRLCRLHRPYHIKGMTDPKYEYSRRVCVRSAQIVLDLRRTMDEARPPVGLQPARFLVIVQHVFLAALTLATDVSFDATAPDAEVRKGKVLAAYETLEKSTEEACGFREVIQNNLRTLMLILERREGPDDSPRLCGSTDLRNGSAVAIAEGYMVRPGEEEDNSIPDPGPWDENRDHLWSEFIAVAPDLDFSHWEMLLNGVDTHSDTRG
ncbi:hypothetical protein BDW59DRAFT_148362 [Aspergillus cavernicola]|uniref:Zn(2)-C6 fungal-type domain-containing protein n=1 Tax=Aspergillus cavernicola TaxID=176166 RepID=A0ABR4I826_9EURO